MTCRWPEKQRHATREAAVAAIRKLYKAGRGNPDYVPYPCGNHHWHIGHSAAHFNDRIRRSLRKRRTKR